MYYERGGFYVDPLDFISEVCFMMLFYEQSYCSYTLFAAISIYFSMEMPKGRAHAKICA